MLNGSSFQQSYRCSAGVKTYGTTQRQCCYILSMATGKINKNGFIQAGQIIAIEFGEMKRWFGFVRILDVHHLSHDNSCSIPEDSCKGQVGEHTVNIMPFLIYILKKQDTSCAIQLPRRSEKRVDKRHTAADQDTFRDAGQNGVGLIGCTIVHELAGKRRLCQQLPHCLLDKGAHVIIDVNGYHGPVECCELCLFPECKMQRGNVAVPHERFWVGADALVIQEGQKSHCPVSST